MLPPVHTGPPNREMVSTALLLKKALAFQEELSCRLAESPSDRSLRGQSEKNEELVDRLIGEYRTAISRYLCRLSKSQLTF